MKQFLTFQASDSSSVTFKEKFSRSSDIQDSSDTISDIEFKLSDSQTSTDTVNDLLLSAKSYQARFNELSNATIGDINLASDSSSDTSNFPATSGNVSSQEDATRNKTIFISEVGNPLSGNRHVPIQRRLFTLQINFRTRSLIRKY